MTRVGKQEERRNRCPRKNKPPALKTGPKKDNLKLGYKERINATDVAGIYIPKIK